MRLFSNGFIVILRLFLFKFHDVVSLFSCFIYILFIYNSFFSIQRLYSPVIQPLGCNGFFNKAIYLSIDAGSGLF